MKIQVGDVVRGSTFDCSCCGVVTELDACGGVRFTFTYTCSDSVYLLGQFGWLPLGMCVLVEDELTEFVKEVRKAETRKE